MKKLFDRYNSPTLKRFRNEYGYFWDDYEDAVKYLERKSWRREHSFKVGSYKDLHYDTF